MADWLFDGPSRTIKEPSSAPDGDTTFNVQQDLYSAWKRWVLTGEGAKYPEAFTTEGGNPVGTTGIFTGKTFTLTNGWRLQAASYNHQVFIDAGTGNLYGTSGIIVTATSGAFSTNVFVNAAVAAQGITVAGGASAAASVDSAAVASAVWAKAQASANVSGTMGRLLRDSKDFSEEASRNTQ